MSHRDRRRAGAAGSPGPPRRRPGRAPRGAGRTCPTSPTRTPATTRPRSATSRGAGTACPTPASRTGSCGDDGGLCHADAAWRGVARREEVRSDPRPSGAGWRVAMGPSKLAAARRARREERSRGLRARGQAPLPDRQAHLRLREGALPQHREEGECVSPPCSPAPTCPCAPGPGGRRSSWGLRGGRPAAAVGTDVPRGRPKGPREGPQDSRGGRI